MRINNQKGFVIPLIIVIIAILAVAGGVFVYQNKKTCPQYMPPAPGFCANGKIIDGGKNALGCQLPPKCEVVATTTPPISTCSCPAGYVLEGESCNPTCYYSTPRCLMPSIMCTPNKIISTTTSVLNGQIYSVYNELGHNYIDLSSAFYIEKDGVRKSGPYKGDIIAKMKIEISKEVKVVVADGAYYSPSCSSLKQAFLDFSEFNNNFNSLKYNENNQWIISIRNNTVIKIVQVQSCTSDGI